MKVLLLCGYRQTNDLALGMNLIDDRPVLDLRIEALRSMGFEVITVTAGMQADDQLRSARQIAKTEFVFDTHGEEATLATNLVAGLKACDKRGALVLPVEITPAPTDVWRQIKHAAHWIGPMDVHVIQAVDAEGAPCHLGFPLYITAKGTAHITQLEDFTRLTDSRLIYHHELLSQDLAPAQNPL